MMPGCVPLQALRQNLSLLLTAGGYQCPWTLALSLQWSGSPCPVFELPWPLTDKGLGICFRTPVKTISLYKVIL